MPLTTLLSTPPFPPLFLLFFCGVGGVCLAARLLSPRTRTLAWIAARRLARRGPARKEAPPAYESDDEEAPVSPTTSKKED